MRAVALASLCLALGCTTTKPCADNTFFVTIHYQGSATGADLVSFKAQIDGGEVLSHEYTSIPTGGIGTLTVRFTTYPGAGSKVAFTLVAKHTGVVVASDSQTITTQPGCTPVDLFLMGSPTDSDAGVDIDGSVTGDAGDMTPTGDLAEPFPAHLTSSDYTDQSGDVTQAVTEINTTDLTIRVDGGTPQPALPGTTLTRAANGAAVYSVGSIQGPAVIHVAGDAPLIVVASKALTLGYGFTIGADHQTPGAGGSGPALGLGAGVNGQHYVAPLQYTGGGGGSFGGRGAVGGDSGAHAGAASGSTYGGSFSQFLGGSGGGNAGYDETADGGACSTLGGAGGGAIQISSKVSITVLSGARIDAGGGGGQGSKCHGAGGGGGSGGAIFLEAPTINIYGEVTANGGGGGSAYEQNPDAFPSGANAGGRAAAPGGDDSLATAGGDGAFGTLSASPGAPSPGGGGGGGGGVGRIFIRTGAGGVQSGSSTYVSPAAELATTL